ncbi:serine/threonine-protein kinase PknG [Micromonospora luteifusca]|uniref:non-specific serine/threonine protein kinase n=1 Tax=Micromonospora luteifusca TaxID=709860 RepID=A0ABS2M1P1_9ACTN|nr:serine/threonine-protein kinase [Micromonospora luteifusca]MBM7494354.1 serine/threonine-protein kinase PknG [Micromonospora luteifusca]
MTVTSQSCVERHCSGEVDADGFCRLWGHECDGRGGAPVTRFVPRPALPSSQPWEEPVQFPAARPRDPLTAVLAEPVVPEHSRICASTTCHTRLPRISGHCPNCGTRYSFTPPLAVGDVRAARYEIAGCLGNGGVGWVFLARDQDMDGAWRVLKGQRNPEDREAVAAFVAERQALIALNHPRIVTITHALRPEAHHDTGYLVMEYVNGGTLEEARSAAGPGGRAAALDPTQALGYGVQILDAFDYLHDQGWLYCDLKPENVMRVGGGVGDDAIKLVDFGAARKIDNRVSPAWGTEGFTAPEVKRLGAAGPSVRSDIYTVGRTLAALTLVTQSTNVSRVAAGEELLRLPTPARLDPFLRLLARATAIDPADRFGSAAQMREQVQGVRLQVASAADGEARPSRSTLFSPSACAFALHTDDTVNPVEVLLGLPVPLVDGTDPAAGFLASLGPAEPDELIELLATAPERTAQVVYRAVRAHLAAGRGVEAEALLADIPVDHQRDWALWWHRGLVALGKQETDLALRWFQQVYDWLPGEVSTRLAYAVACELADNPDAAADHYRGVWDTDRGVLAAAFGLARCRLATADPRGAANALLSVPESSRACTEAVACAVRILLDAPDDGRRLATALEAAAIVDKLPPFAERETVESHILRIALSCDLAGSEHAGRRLFGQPLDDDSLRRAFERRCRSRARRTADQRERIALVDLANSYRPVTWW